MRNLLGWIVVLVVASIVVGTPVAGAQHAGKIRRLGYLSPAARPSERDENFKQALRELGWVEGQNIGIDYRWAADKLDRLPSLAEELVRRKVDLIVAWSTPAVQAAKSATRTIPVVMGYPADPVGSGFVANLARPGGNMTGVSLMAPELAGKRLELLRELIPGLARVAFLANAGDPAHHLFVKEAEDAGPKLGLQVRPFVIKGPDEFEGAFATMTRERVGALVVQPLFVSVGGHGPRLAELAVRHHLPTVSDGNRFAEAGGLVYYGPDRPALDRLVAIYVHRILKGAKPGELPVEQPAEVSARGQSPDGKAAWPGDPTVDSRSCGQGDRLNGRGSRLILADARPRHHAVCRGTAGR